MLVTLLPCCHSSLANEAAKWYGRNKMVKREASSNAESDLPEHPSWYHCFTEQCQSDSFTVGLSVPVPAAYFPSISWIIYTRIFETPLYYFSIEEWVWLWTQQQWLCKGWFTNDLKKQLYCFTLHCKHSKRFIILIYIDISTLQT